MKIAFPTMSASTPAGTASLGNDYVRTVVINDVDDVFDADALWALPRAWGSDKTRLKGIVASTETRVGAFMQVRPSVVLELPSKAVEHDRRIASGMQIDELVRQLAARHSDDFKKLLPEHELPHYSVRAAPDLADDQVRVRIGYAIYVPNPDESVVWQIQTSLDGVIWNAAPPSLLTERQRLFILGGSANTGSQVCMHWPFEHTTGLVIINDPGKDKLDFGDEPLGSLRIDFDDNSGCYVVKARGAGANPDARLYVRATRLMPLSVPSVPSRDEPDAPNQAESASLQPHRQPDKIEPVFDLAPLDPNNAMPQTVQAPESSESEPTLHACLLPKVDESADDKTYFQNQPVHQASISLEGLAIQRPSLFQTQGVRSLRWGLDAGGGVVSPQSEQGVLIFSVASDDSISVETKMGKRLLGYDDPLPLPSGALVKLVSLPSPLNEIYLGWIKLPLGRPQPLPANQTVGVGRELNTLAPLQALSGKGFLGDGKDSSGDRMGLSRRHFELQAGPQGLLVRALGINTVAHLDNQMAFVGTITAEQPAVLEDGHCLVVGHYVWRYNA